MRMQPLGCPVVPLVYIIMAGESGVGGLLGKRSDVERASLNLVMVMLEIGDWTFGGEGDSSASIMMTLVTKGVSLMTSIRELYFVEITKINLM